MNIGERYVLTIADVFKGAESGKDKARVSGFDNLIFDDNGLGKLEKLEDVLQEACDNARHEGYVQGREEEIKNLTEQAKKAYNDGLNHAWECARKLVHPDRGGLTREAKMAITGKPDSDYILLEYTASEAIAKIKEYTDNELRIGDEVIVGNDKNGYLEAKFIVTGFNKEGSVYLLNRGNGGSTIAFRKGCHKTGKHFQQISQVLEKGDE